MTDSERDGVDADADAIHAWAALARAQRLALRAIETALKQAGLPPLGWYDVLLELSRRPEGVRPKALEPLLLLEQYNVSRLADRLVAAGLVERRVDPEDARARLLVITAEGAALRARMWPVYRDAARRALGAALAPSEIATLTRLLRRVATAAREGAAGENAPAEKG